MHYLITSIAIVISLSASAFADPPTVYVLDLEQTAAAKALISAQKLDVDTCTSGALRVYVKADEFKSVKDSGISYTLVEEQPNPPAFDDGRKQLGQYHSYSELTAALQAFVAAYPTLCRLDTAGPSGQGRALWYLSISDNVDLQEDEPEFKYIATMHGDEVMGTEMCLYFINELLTNYGQSTPAGQRATRLINETDIAIMPLMNPDGHTLGTRYNANGTDLNRAFPSFLLGEHDGTIFEGAPVDIAGREPEVQAVMNWVADHSFVASANFHGGALVVNYPFDEAHVPNGAYAICPDDALFIDISKRYSQLNLPMWNSPVFDMGITNGSAWYQVTGGMQDWHYRYLSCNDLTIEISNQKRPSESLIDDYWDDNRESMFAYLDSVHIGVRGLVTNAITGAPVYAQVVVAGIDQPVFTDADVGDFHRMLLPGSYTITVTAPEYETQTIQNLIVTTGPATRIEIELVPVGITEGEGEGEGEGVIENPHTGDQNANGRFDLSELLRLVQLYNSAFFGCDESTEDGYAVEGGDTECITHSLDYAPQNWVLSLSEILRAIQIFNAGGYFPCPDAGTEDGFCLPS